MSVTVPAAMVARLRRLTAELVGASTYSDADLVESLERYPLTDNAGALPDSATWAGVWDINCAAADIWEEKAAAMAAAFDFAADGGDYKRSQAYAQMMQSARSFRARRATTTLTMVAEPPPEGAVRAGGWIGNLAE